MRMRMASSGEVVTMSFCTVVAIDPNLASPSERTYASMSGMGLVRSNGVSIRPQEATGNQARGLDGSS
jgi:hypothetical protein